MITEANSVEWPELICNAKAGDAVALNEIMVRLYDYLLAIANGKMNRSLSGKFGISDIVQKSCLDAQNGICQFQGTSEIELRAWFKRILIRNLQDATERFTQTKARDVRREQPANWLQIPDSGIDNPIRMQMRSETSELLSTAIERLDERHRFVIQARHQWDWGYDQIATDLGCTEVAARKLWMRAVKNLKKMLAT